MNLEVTPLITTDGFKFYERVIWRVFGPACVYGQVIKTRRNDRIVGRAQSRDRSWAIEASSAGLGGLTETEHVFCRTAESHDSTELVVSGSPNDMSSPMEAISRRSPGVSSLPLQFRSAPQGAEIRTGG